MKLLSRTSAIFDRLLDFLAYFGCGLLALACLAVCIEIVMRYFLNRPQIWVVESTEYVLLITTFLGGAYVLRKGGHVMIDIVPMRLSQRAAAMLGSIMSIFGAAGCLVIVWYGVYQTVYHFQQGLVTTTALRLPKYPFLAVIAAGSFLMFLQFLRRSYGYHRSWRALGNKQQGRRASWNGG